MATSKRDIEKSINQVSESEEFNKYMRKVLERRIFPIVRQILLKHIQADILDEYTPVEYDRRSPGGGGIADPNTITKKMLSDLEMLVTSEAYPSMSVMGTPYRRDEESSFFQWIEFGLVPNIFSTWDYEWMHPRRAMERAQKEVDANPEIKRIIQEEMQKFYQNKQKR